MRRSSLMVAVIVGGTLLAACQASAPSSTEDTPGGAPAAGQAAPAAGPVQNVTLTDIFPAAPERDMVLNTCATCHAVACVAQGRKTPERWASLKASHMETAGGGAELDAIFAYLQKHFNDTTPEPQVPPELLQQGCTPF